MSLEKALRCFFGDKEKRVAIVGVGNPYRGDDGIGPKLIEILETKSLKNVLLINAESVPEAFIKKVEEYNPTHVLMLDAANFNGQPGDTRLISGEEINRQTLSTHNLPLNIFISYLKETDVSVIVLGIQPYSIEYGDEISLKVKAAGNIIVDILYKIISE